MAAIAVASVVAIIAAPAPATATPDAKPTWELKNVEALTRVGEFMAPVWSPTGLEILASGPQYTGLYLVRAVGGPSRMLVPDQYAGFEPQFTPDGMTVYYRTKQLGRVTFAGVTVLGARVATDGKELAASHPEGYLAYADHDQIILVAPDGTKQAISGTADKYYGPMFSPDNKRLLYRGISTGLYLYDMVDGRALFLGRGNHPSFSPDGKRLAFDVSEDDGAVVLASDLYLYDLENGGKFRLTASRGRNEQHPAISPDGKRIAFDAGGVLYTGHLVRK